MRCLHGNPPTTRVGKVMEKLREKGSETGMCSGLCNQMEGKDSTPLRSATVAEGHVELLGARSRLKKPSLGREQPKLAGQQAKATRTGTLGAGATRDAKPTHSRADRHGLKVNLRAEAG